MTRPARRGGYTLLEMMLVLGLIVALLGLAWPALRTRIARQRLESAAHDVRTELSKARLGAIQSGCIWEVRYAPGEGRLCVTCPDESAADSSARSGDAVAELALRKQEIALPLGVCFAIDSTLPGLPVGRPEALAPPAAPASLYDASPEDGGAWSHPIRFFPDGTADDVEIVLENEAHDAVAVELEGLTGIARVGGVARAVDAGVDSHAAR